MQRECQQALEEPGLGGTLLARLSSMGSLLSVLWLLAATARAAPFDLKSPVLSQGKEIPEQYTADGEGISPPLYWTGVPAGTRELVLVMDDTDVKNGAFTHWILYDLPPDISNLPQDSDQGIHGKNSQGTVAYVPPAPPVGDPPHHYHFRLYALDRQLDLKPGLDELALMSQIQDHVIGEAELVATYARS